MILILKPSNAIQLHSTERRGLLNVRCLATAFCKSLDSKSAFWPFLCFFLAVCDWVLKTEITLDTRQPTGRRLSQASGGLEYFAQLEIYQPGIYTLVYVPPLVDEDVEINVVTHTEDSDGVAISPLMDLNVKSDNSWDVRYPNLRVKGVNITIVEGYVEGSDVSEMAEEVPGFRHKWFEDGGVLRLEAIDGFDFTENTWEDYEEGHVEVVDVSEVLDKEEPTATLEQFSVALKKVIFSTDTLGKAARVMELSVDELLTSDVIARISWVTIANTPDPPLVIPTSTPGFVRERAGFWPVDSGVQVGPLPTSARGRPPRPLSLSSCPSDSCLTIWCRLHCALRRLSTQISRQLCEAVSGSNPPRQATCCSTKGKNLRAVT